MRPLKPFQFKEFAIQQSAAVFRVGTDAVLLGALGLANRSCRGQLLEIGTGTGVVALMLAQRFPEAEITAIDVNPEAVALAQLNFQNSPYHLRLKAIEVDFKAFNPPQRFDFIVCNPPYFEPNASEKDVLARQKTALDFDDLLQNSARILSDDGVLSVIIPADFKTDFERKASVNKLYLQSEVLIKGIETASKIKRVILEFSKQPQSLMTEHFVIEKSPRQYSDQYLEATRDFHCFKTS